MRKFTEFAFASFVIVALFGITVFFIILPRMEQTVMTEKKTTIREMVHSIEYLLNTYQEDVSTGSLDISEAKKRAIRRIRSFRYGLDEKNYFWIIDLQGRVCMHPNRPDIVDQNLDMLKDEDAKQLIQEFINNANQKQERFFEYLWKDRPNSTERQRKIAYSSLFKPWGWLIGSSFYYDDAVHEIALLTRDLTIIGLGVLLLTTFISGYLTWRGWRAMRKQNEAETALKHSENRLRTLFMRAQIPMMIVDIEKNVITEINDLFANVIGYTIEELSMESNLWEKVYPDSDYRQMMKIVWRTAVEKALNNDAITESGEFNVMCKDGKMRTMLVGASAIEKNMLINFIDISDLRKEESNKLKHLELLRATFNATPDGMLVVNKEGHITHVNQKFYEMWQLSESFDYPIHCFEFVNLIKNQLEDPNLLLSEFENLYTCQNFSEIRFADGRTFESNSCPMFIDKKQVGCVWDFRDITDHKKAEAERHDLQEQLLQSQKMEAIGILAGGVAHDFNNMLGAIIGYAELGMGKIDSVNDIHHYFSRIYDAAQRSANLTRQLLAFARKQTVMPILFDINTSMNHLIKMLHRLIGENIELIWLPMENPCPVLMDPGQFDQILVNLCVNAKDAINGLGTITIKTALVAFDEVSSLSHIDCTPGEYVQLTVSDNGCGMDDETAAHIFEPFYSTKGLGQGTGLGLSTIYGIVKQNKGFIKLDSKPQIGSTFNIYIPVHHGDTDNAVLRSESDLDHPQSHGETILMVEDDPILHETSEIMLCFLGYNVLSAKSPSEAIRLAEENRDDIQLFITDVIMPEMNGQELATRLKDIAPQMKHLYMSGYTANVIAHHGILDKDINFIQKPFSLKTLALKIRAILDSEAAHLEDVSQGGDAQSASW